MTLTERLIQLMQERKINRSELAKGADIPYTTIVALFEKGTENIKLSTLRKLADYFEVTLDDLVEGKDSDKNPHEIHTIAAHHDGEDWTEEELEAIEKFKKFVRSERNKG